MYDIIVIGGGHAGIESCLASSRMGINTLLITSDFSKVGFMPCNPSIGGPAKGIVVREIDALGGEMGRAADATLIQMKVLNHSKGPAVQSLRAQIDRIYYPKYMQNIIKNQNKLDVFESTVDELVVENNKIIGVICNNKQISAKKVIITTGTYMQSNVLISDTRKIEGPDGMPTNNLSDSIRNLGISTFRLKTGTPPRIAKDSIDYSKVEIQDGDAFSSSFSFYRDVSYDINNQLPCYLTYTTSKTQDIIVNNLLKSSMFGAIEDLNSVGPRYCPSIEDKIYRFNDKPRHQIFLEPESREYDDIYVQGFSTSMPIEIQEEMVKSIIGLENAKILKYAYAIEYDAIDPTQLYKTLESKEIEGLYFAGQVNGTSGYEEAGGQGLVAGINAALSIQNKQPLILQRDNSYIGVMIDDLVTKGTLEPYRLLTSRAEFRLLLRSDNANLRLSKLGFEVGLLSQLDYNNFVDYSKRVYELIDKLQLFKINPTINVNNYLKSVNCPILTTTVTASDLFKRPEVNYNHVKYITNIDESDLIYKQVEIELKYEGYIKKMNREVEKLGRLENVVLPNNLDYYKFKNLSLESKEKLSKIRPINVGQASRINGVTPADISILLIEMRGIKDEKA